MRVEDNGRYYNIFADEGMWLTTYTDVQPIENYSAYKNSSCPHEIDLSVYREITNEQKEIYDKEFYKHDTENL